MTIATAVLLNFYMAHISNCLQAKITEGKSLMCFASHNVLEVLNISDLLQCTLEPFACELDGLETCAISHPAH